jgi:copper(I)-binding protein
MRSLLFFALWSAAVAQAADIEVKSPWARATVRAQTTSSAYMELRSAQGATLLGASSPVAGSVELHEMKMEGNVMKMRALPRLALPPGKAVKLTPSGYHLMLYELKGQLVQGTRVPLRLEFERGGKRETVEVSAEVRGLR